MQQLILGSSSPFRAELLNKLGLTFIQVSPDIDETPQSDESPATLVQRLAESKAREIARTHPEALIIGSDQVAVIDDDILGKPGNHQNAMAQLKSASGRKVTFLTGLALLNAKNGHIQSSVEPFSVHFRTLTDNQIDFYLKKEQPYQCAGSFKSEGFGISLFSKLDGEDPNTLIGLPLRRLIQMLQHEDIDVLQLNH
ncbi:Maf family protein [Methylophaga sp. OBS1]|uniref:Maf family protein n=1 Tax=Methylophaga sp. OBS1 TaxID=2991933 RepID=UPI0022586450|nr:nucleoside triphosphate pyrophosphatase [Methylophaga sp. OBS1]MCX4191735.1 Maf-like protein [Methylophaga sp. OBS1]